MPSTQPLFCLLTIVQPDLAETPDYLAWVEQTRLKIEEGISAADQGAVLEADDVLSRLRNKVEAARSASA